TMRHPCKTFPYARWGDSSRIKVGDKVFAMGSPGSLAQSVTFGIVSNTELILPGGVMRLDGENVGSLVRWIAHDAAIYHGNSGGPLVNLQGEIIGINELGFVGLGGAIPSNLAQEITAALITQGEVTRSWTGLEVQPLLRSLNQEQGVLVSGVTKDSPAAQAGLRSGDFILRYDNQPVSVRYGEEMPHFNRMVLNTPVGKTVTVEVLREGKTQQFQITTTARHKIQEPNEEVLTWGITAQRKITTRLARELQRATTDGVGVSSVRPGGPCGQARPPIQWGDIIIKIGDRSVKDLAELRAISAEITQGKDKPVPTVVAFERGTQQLLTVVKIGPSEEKKVPPEVRKSWFPAATQVFTRSLAKAMGFKGKKGVCITQLYPPLAGQDTFQVGDILIALDNVPIQASELEHQRVFRTMIRQYKIGTEAIFTVIRGKEEIKIPFALVQEPKPVREFEKYKDTVFEFEARELGMIDKARKKLPESQRGVLIEAVDPGGWASLAYLVVGDVLRQVDNQEISNIEDLKKVMKQLAKEKPKRIIFFVKRGIYNRYLELEPDWTQK
ncbi:PDZ domain-containing protein, partial [Planctomycetota bacterium]